MKRNVIFLICLTISTMVFGQNETKQINVDVKEVEVTPPKFTGVENAISNFEVGEFSPIENYLAKYFVCPTETAICRKEGTEIIQFTVNPNGSLSNFRVINSVCREVDKEMINVLRRTKGMWLPGNNNGEPIAMEQEVSLMIGDYDQDEIVNHFVGQAEKYFTMGSSTLLVVHKPKKALRFYNKGVRYLPKEQSILTFRGLCKYELGDIGGAKEDWNRVVTLGGNDYTKDFFELTEMKDYSEMKGYEEMTSILSKNKSN